MLGYIYPVMFWGADNELQEDEVNFFRIRKNGELSTNTAEGHSVSRNVTITCDEPASLKVSVSSRARRTPWSVSGQRNSTQADDTGWFMDPPQVTATACTSATSATCLYRRADPD